LLTYLTQMKYIILAYDQLALDACNGNVCRIEGSTSEREADTLKEAKDDCNYLLSEESRRADELNYCIVYVQIKNNKGECIFEKFA
jgi:hypothetical protein